MGNHSLIYQLGLIDYGMGNLGSILNMCKFLSIEASISDDIKTIKNLQDEIKKEVNDSDIPKLVKIIFDFQKH